VSCHTADSIPVKQDVNGTVKLPPLVFSALAYNTAILKTAVKCFIVSAVGFSRRSAEGEPGFLTVVVGTSHRFKQGSLTEGEGSAQLTSLY
jgi:hypothetical protein